MAVNPSRSELGITGVPDLPNNPLIERWWPRGNNETKEVNLVLNNLVRRDLKDREGLPPEELCGLMAACKNLSVILTVIQEYTTLADRGRKELKELKRKAAGAQEMIEKAKEMYQQDKARPGSLDSLLTVSSNMCQKMHEAKEQAWRLNYQVPNPRAYLREQTNAYRIMNSAETEELSDGSSPSRIDITDKENLRQLKIEKQLTDDELYDLCQFVIENGGSLTDIEGVINDIRRSDTKQRRPGEENKIIDYLKRQRKILEVIRRYVPTLTDTNRGLVESLRIVAGDDPKTSQLLETVSEGVFTRGEELDFVLWLVRRASDTFDPEERVKSLREMLDRATGLSAIIREIIPAPLSRDSQQLAIELKEAYFQYPEKMSERAFRIICQAALKNGVSLENIRKELEFADRYMANDPRKEDRYTERNQENFAAYLKSCFNKTTPPPPKPV